MHVDLWQRYAMRRAALRYAHHGWPVLPGAPLVGKRYVCGPLCPTVGPHPSIEEWERRASWQVADVERWWASVANSVLLATGRVFDVIDVPGKLGRSAARAASIGPVAVTPSDRWMFFVKPGDALRPDLSSRPDLVLHGNGSWIPAPPTRTPDGRVRWEIHPIVTGWRLPRPHVVQQVLASQLHTPGRPATFATMLRMRHVA
jgi:hypothetical protein